jgi:hypothetical protein
MSKKTLAMAKDQDCVRCGSNGTTVTAHYTGLRQHQFGKGFGVKCDDVASAWLCHECHDYFDKQITERKSIERSEEFLFLIVMTNIKRFGDGQY